MGWFLHQRVSWWHSSSRISGRRFHCCECLWVGAISDLYSREKQGLLLDKAPTVLIGLHPEHEWPCQAISWWNRLPSVRKCHQLSPLAQSCVGHHLQDRTRGWFLLFCNPRHPGWSCIAQHVTRIPSPSSCQRYYLHSYWQSRFGLMCFASIGMSEVSSNEITVE